MTYYHIDSENISCWDLLITPRRGDQIYLYRSDATTCYAPYFEDVEVHIIPVRNGVKNAMDDAIKQRILSLVEEHPTDIQAVVSNDHDYDDFLLDLNVPTRKIRLPQGQFNSPEIININCKNITIPALFEISVPAPEKIQKKKAAILAGTGKPITLDKNYFLVDGYASYLAYQELGYTIVPCVIKRR